MAGFSGRLRPAGQRAAFGAGPRKPRSRLVLPLGCRGIAAQYDAGQLPGRERPASESQSAAKLRLHNLLHRVQG